jgi:hypothetical protein
MGAVRDHLDALVDRAFMMLPTSFSFPGMAREEKITRSPAPA